MKSIAFIFSHAPHGNTLGREGLDMLLSFSLVFQRIGVFFIDDGVLQLVPNQNTKHIFLRNYTRSFKILSLYGITDFFFVKILLQKED